MQTPPLTQGLVLQSSKQVTASEQVEPPVQVVREAQGEERRWQVSSKYSTAKEEPRDCGTVVKV